MKELGNRAKNAFHIAFSNNYDQDVKPEDYERHVKSAFSNRERLAQELGTLFDKHLSLRKTDAPASILDLGAGTGIISTQLHKQGYKVTATDISHHALTYLRTKNPEITTDVVDLNTHFPFKDNSFDGATTVWANRFIVNSDNFLEEVYRVLKPQGVFIWPVFGAEIPLWKYNAGMKQPATARGLVDQIQHHGFTKVSTEMNSLRGIKQRGLPPYAAPSYIIAKK